MRALCAHLGHSPHYSAPVTAARHDQIKRMTPGELRELSVKLRRKSRRLNEDISGMAEEIRARWAEIEATAHAPGRKRGH